MEYKNTFDDFDLDVQKKIGNDVIINGVPGHSFQMHCLTSVGCNHTLVCGSAAGGCFTLMGASCLQCGATFVPGQC